MSVELQVVYTHVYAHAYADVHAHAYSHVDAHVYAHGTFDLGEKAYEMSADLF